MNLKPFRLPLTLTAPLALAAALTACVSSDDAPPADGNSAGGGSTSASNTNTNTNATNNTTATANATTGSGGSSSGSTDSASTTGAAGADAGLDCSSPPAVAADSVIDFESYDGTAEAEGWEFNFNGDEADVGAVYAGLWLHTDGTGAYSLSFVAGADGSDWALRAQNDSGSDWGGGIGMWAGCMDASAHTGIQFMVSGSTPVGTGSMSMDVPDGTVSADFTMPADGEWTLVQIPFSAFVADGLSTDGSGIGNFTFSAHMIYMPDSTGEYVPEPGAFELTIDNIGFY